GASGKLQTIDFTFDLGEKYNLWSGLIAGLFLMLSYFGTDQSQVQRYLTAKSLGDARMSLMLSAILKVPMQFFILLLGVYLYVFYVFEPHPLLFSPQPQKIQCQDQTPPMEAEFQFWQSSRKTAALGWTNGSLPPDEARERYETADAALQTLRKQELLRQESLSGQSRNDTNYVFPHFMLTQLPIGILGLIVAAILAAALSSIDSMLNSLAATTVVDWYQRLRPEPREDAFYLRLTRWSTAGWGVLATLSAIAFGETESIIELTNQLGSYFYGPMLGVFVLIWCRWATPRGTLWGLGLGLLGVMIAGSWYHGYMPGEYTFLFPLGRIPEGFEPVLEYLWLNPLGTILTLSIAWFWRERNKDA
ncbi:MAG: sodium-coupled permease, partial [Bacteroidota bacterium]